MNEEQLLLLVATRLNVISGLANNVRLELLRDPLEECQILTAQRIFANIEKAADEVGEALTDVLLERHNGRAALIIAQAGVEKATVAR